MQTKFNNKFEKKLLEKVHQDAVKKIVTEYMEFSQVSATTLSDLNRVSPIFNLLKKRFFQGLDKSLLMSGQSLLGLSFNKKRISAQNRTAKKYLAELSQHFPPAGKIWVLNGLMFDHQVAGLKKLTGLADDEGLVIDVLNSAASLSLGSENPWLTKMDYIEDLFGIRDNFCAAYHPSKKQAFALRKLAGLHPNANLEIGVHVESSGTIVDSIAIETCVAYAEKQFGDKYDKKILAVDGTWAGGYGSAREGTGFGVNDQQHKKLGKNVWVDRCLPAPTKENFDIFIKALKNKLASKTVAGIYLEPDVVGDLGLLVTDRDLLVEVKSLMGKNHLPIILDCVQQLGRSGSYWGENVNKVFSDYPLLVVTAAKSASNGQAFGFTAMPMEILCSASPRSQITTNQMNSSMLRSLAVAEVLSNPKLQKWLRKKTQDIEEVAKKYGFSLGSDGLRGKYLNRGVYLENNELVKLAQIALLVEDGVLVGATPNSIRYQPMLLEYSQTNKNIAELIFRRLKLVKEGKVSSVVQEIFQNMMGIDTGLARNNK